MLDGFKCLLTVGHHFFVFGFIVKMVEHIIPLSSCFADVLIRCSRENSVDADTWESLSVPVQDVYKRQVLDDADYNQYDKALAVLVAFYPDISDIPQEHYKEALEWCMWFIRFGDEEPDGKTPRLIDWNQDIRYIVSPINRVAGMEVRDVEYMHWWTCLLYTSRCV